MRGIFGSSAFFTYESVLKGFLQVVKNVRQFLFGFFGVRFFKQLYNLPYTLIELSDKGFELCIGLSHFSTSLKSVRQFNRLQF